MKALNAAVVSSWVLQLVVAAILLQTLFFKFTGAPESVYIFSTLGAEPWGRIGSGVVELVAAISCSRRRPPPSAPRWRWGDGGRDLSHLTVLGLEVHGDGGLLFGLALTVFVASGVILLLRRGEIPIVGSGCARTRSRSADPFHSGVERWPLRLPCNRSSACSFRCVR